MTSPIQEVRVDAANEEALGRLVAADPALVGIAPAGEAVVDADGLGDRWILHSGPPIEFAEMCGAQRGAVLGMAIFEGWARDVHEARSLIESGVVRLAPNHDHGGVGPLAGTTSPSLPVFVVENREASRRAFCRPTDAAQQFGDYAGAPIAQLRHWRDVRGPAVGAALKGCGGISLRPLFVRALCMGDDLHDRCNALSALIASALAPPLVEAGLPTEQLVATLRWLGADESLGLALTMASGKSAADAADGVEGSTLVTAMACNGVDFGIRVSGLPGRWFTAPAPAIDGLYLPGFSERDAGLDLGDSAITETVGWGSFALAGAPALLALAGGTPAEAQQISRDMRDITLALSPDYRMPVFGFEGAPVGIDLRKVVRTRTVPVIDAEIAHREEGHPKIGAGLVRAPSACFTEALEALTERHDLP